MTDRLFTIPEVSAATGVPRSTLHHWLDIGRLPYIAAGSYRLMRAEQIADILDLRATHGNGKRLSDPSADCADDTQA